MTDTDITKALRLIESAEASLSAARKLLGGQKSSSADKPFKTDESSFSSYEEGDTHIIEGVFDGQNMLGPAGRIFPVAPNYVSKSKLVEGDKLKLTIMPNGALLYKQIEPMERETLRGTLIKEDGQYKVLTDDGTFKVILASVTYYKGKEGDEVSLIVPAHKKSTWGAIEAIIPNVEGVAIDEDESF